MATTAPPPPPPMPVGGDVNHGPELNGLIWFFTALATMAFAGRLYARIYLTRNLGWDDLLMGISVVMVYIQCAFVSASVYFGLGRHMLYIAMENPSHISMVVKWQFLSEPVAILGPNFAKIAVTMMIIKLLSPSTTGKVWLWTINVVLNVENIVSLILNFLQCTPIETYWTKSGGTCWDPHYVTDVALAGGALSAFTDLSLALFPVGVIWGLQMPLKRKIAVCTLMGLGCFAGIAAIVRTVKLSKLSARSDFTWEIWTLVLWVAIESNIVILCACGPSLRPLLRFMSGKITTSTFPSLPSRLRRSTSRFKVSDSVSPGGSEYNLEPGSQSFSHSGVGGNDSVYSGKGMNVEIGSRSRIGESKEGDGKVKGEGAGGIGIRTDVSWTNEPSSVV